MSGKNSHRKLETYVFIRNGIAPQQAMNRYLKDCGCTEMLYGELSLIVQKKTEKVVGLVRHYDEHDACEIVVGPVRVNGSYIKIAKEKAPDAKA